MHVRKAVHALGALDKFFFFSLAHISYIHGANKICMIGGMGSPGVALSAGYPYPPALFTCFSFHPAYHIRWAVILWACLSEGGAFDFVIRTSSAAPNHMNHKTVDGIDKS